MYPRLLHAAASATPTLAAQRMQRWIVQLSEHVEYETNPWAPTPGRREEGMWRERAERGLKQYADRLHGAGGQQVTTGQDR